MGILGSSISITRYKVAGDLPLFGTEQFLETAQEALVKYGFQSIMEYAVESSVGWVQMNNQENAIFDNPGFLWIGDYLTFSLRRDVRVIPTLILNSEIKKECDKYLEDHPNLRRIPKQVFADKKEAVKVALLSRQLPDSQVWDVAWDTRNEMIYLFNTSGKAMDTFESMFKKTFPAFSLRYLTPWQQAQTAADHAEVRYDLDAANLANSPAVLDLIKSNAWLGRDFLLWLLSGCGKVSNEGLTAWVDSRIDMAGISREGGIEKITVTGSQDDAHMATVKSALREGHYVTKAMLYYETNESEAWNLTLTGDTFAINQMKTPNVHVEICDDATSEYQAAFLEKMYLINKGLDHLQSLLTEFIKLRVTYKWDSAKRSITEWMGE